MRVAAASVTWADAARQAAFERWLADVGLRHGADTELAFVPADTPAGPRYLQALQQAQQQADAPEVERLMRAALAGLVRLQQTVSADLLPPCDEARLQRELALFPTWCVECEHGKTWSAAEQAIWQRVSTRLIDSALAQPVVAMHGDFAPRQLHVTTPGPTVLGFDRAAAGPIAYDLVSLLRDGSLAWPEEQELDWAVRWWQQARRAGLPVDADFGEFWRGFEWAGLLRHLGLIGALCRRKHGGEAAGGVDAAELQGLFNHASRVALRYAPLKPLLRLIEPMSGARVDAGFTF
ncbi:Aminoglycoside phosphotransferase [Rubrivivax sp. A210]|uniref:aminoglycoside phosphotransferase family protein n=1 Tax=Rubrivivax sp. A210 TaxID=2772301 RepID=UPI00191A1BB3|nr:phosphotransferase [Rubrivivax sp. A210]CAD5373171.1 Aminoglycoside phosphotransferase [Rubrivivax sp. A210]